MTEAAETPAGQDPALEREVERQFSQLRRGVVDCVSAEELRRRLCIAIREGRPLRVKLGFDPTSADLHLGHAVVLRKLRQFQDLGHHAVFIVGGATAMLGDPSGKDKTRPQLSREQVDANAATYLAQATRVVASRERHVGGGSGEIEIRSNADWFLRFGFAEFIRLASKMTVARMIERDSFTKRIKDGQPIGIHEFLYPLLQGQDSVEVRADVELGGTDQLFNLLVGRDLQVDAGQPPQICLTTPLLPGLDGVQKMSKSLGNSIGLTFSPDEVFGKVMSVPDALMEAYYTHLTDLADAEWRVQVKRDPREAKAALAARLVDWLHGATAGDGARGRFDRLFRDREVPADVERVVLRRSEVPGARLWIADLLCRLKFATSRSEARRLVQGGGVKLDGVVVADEKVEVVLDREILVQAGKRRFARVALSD
jgi:tyrosyl-tRNA synthetase